MFNKKGVIRRRWVMFDLLFLIIFVLYIQIVTAGPYGYGDSMDLKYSLSDGKISYWYGDRIKHTTSLKLWGDVKEKIPKEKIL